MDTLEFSEKNGELTALLRGELDHCLAASVREQIDEKLIQLRASSLVLDLSRISFMDSSGLGLIMGRYAVCRKNGVDFRLRGADGRVIKMLELAGLSRVIGVEENAKGGSRK
ncbi:MAG: anti-sigma factor antagonist [Clostridia bacterium]|nr:anti-sigma factor antagonist [Clostridia bacterium]